MSLVNTRLQAFRSNVTPLDKWETRAGRWGFLELFNAQTQAGGGVITDDLRQKAIAAVGSELQVPVFNYDDTVTVTNQTIPVVTADSPNTSALVNITFTQFYWSFLIHPARHFNQEIPMQRDFDEKMRKHTFKFLDLLDNLCGSALEAVKTQVLQDTLGGRYSLGAGNVVLAPNNEEINVIGDLNPLFYGNDFFDQIAVVGNGSLDSMLRTKLLPNGAFNSQDQTFQWLDKTFYFSNNLPNAVGHKATGFAVQPGAVGLLQQFAPDCVLGNQTSKHAWDIDTLPIANMPIGTYYYEDAVNAGALDASTAHLTATKAEAYAFHTAIATITPYNSAPATRPSAAMKFAVQNAA